MATYLECFFAVAIIIGIVTPAFGRNNENIDRVIIGFESVGSKQNILDAVKKYNGEVIEEIPAINAIVINVLSKLRIALNSDGTLNKYARYIEDDVIVAIPSNEITMASVNSVRLTPDDPLYANLWRIQLIQANYT